MSKQGLVTGGPPLGQHYFCSTPSLKTPRAGLNASEGTLWMTLNWTVQLTHLRDGMPPKGTLTGLRTGTKWISSNSTMASAKLCTCICATPSINTDWGGHAVLSWTICSSISHPHSIEFLPYFQVKSTTVQFKAIPFCPITTCTCKMSLQLSCSLL